MLMMKMIFPRFAELTSEKSRCDISAMSFCECSQRRTTATNDDDGGDGDGDITAYCISFVILLMLVTLFLQFLCVRDDDDCRPLLHVCTFDTHFLSVIINQTHQRGLIIRHFTNSQEYYKIV